MTTSGSPNVTRRTVLRGGAGAAGAAALSGTAVGQESGSGEEQEERPPDWPAYVSDARDGSTADRRGQDSVTVEVGAGGSGLAFSPTQLWIDPGTTITFEWVSDGHNVLPNSQPSGAGWEGSGESLEDTGFTYEHTFETEGMYSYYCAPHEGVGMKGAIAVGEDVPRASPGGGEGFTLPGGVFGFTLVAVPFGALVLGMATILFGEYVTSIRRAPPDVADHGPAEDGTTREVAAELPGQTEEIDHDSFDPTGTAGLIVIYFLILVGMWIFIYFVEFLGGGPVVTG